MVGKKSPEAGHIHLLEMKDEEIVGTSLERHLEAMLKQAHINRDAVRCGL